MSEYNLCLKTERSYSVFLKMECNKEDALKLTERARKHIQWGMQQLETAKILLEKSDRMYPSQDAKGTTLI